MDFATPRLFANAKEEPDDDPRRGQTLETKIYESRYNSHGQRITLRAGTQRSARERTEVDQESALVLTRFYDRDRELEYTSMEVRSPHIRAALRAVIKSYPQLTFDAGTIIIRDEPRCIFHYRDELREYGLHLTDATATQHLVFFLNYMYNSLSREISSYYAFMESPTVAPGIEHEFLWMAFKPGSFILHIHNGIQRILKLTSIEKGRFHSWALSVKQIAYDGEIFGFVTTGLRIPWYDGYKPLQELSAYPLRYHPRQDEIIKSVSTRGRKYAMMRALSHRYYSGVTDSLSPQRITSMDGEEDMYSTRSMMIKGRIIIDCKKFSLVRPTHKPYISEDGGLKTDLHGEPIIADDEWCLFESTIPGFSLSAKRWCFFELDRMTEFEYDTRAFEALVLAEEQKSMLSSLVKAHSEELQFDDIVKGKGKGLIFLLHGEAGVGKTLTAESLADYTKRPLYSVSCGDLGTTATECESALVEILDLATGWNAVLLIDEADVFLEQRSNNDLVRNGIVAVFLRLLEYFEGIMFLTTNRIKNFDSAFKSRIHLAIKYPGLSSDSQRQLWTTFITNDAQRPVPRWLTDTLLHSLAAKALNGRQIRNVVRTAIALAIAAGRELHPKDIHTSLKVMKNFDRDFEEALRENDKGTALNDDRDTERPERLSETADGAKRRRLI